MEELPLSTLGLVGVAAVGVVGLVLWKLFKLALKLVVLLVGAAILAGVVALYLKGAPPSLPTGTLGRPLPGSGAPR